MAKHDDDNRSQQLDPEHELIGRVAAKMNAPMIGNISLTTSSD